MKRRSLFIIPNALSTARLLAGPAFLIWGSLPMHGLVLAGLIAAAATDLVDGRLARTFDVASNFGGGLDTTADKVFTLALALKLADIGVLPIWAFVVLIAQYLLLASIGTRYSLRFHHIPVPELSAHTAAALAVAVVFVGGISLDHRWTIALAVCLMAANLWHLVIALRRAAGIQP